MIHRLPITRRAALAGFGAALAAPAIRPSFAQSAPIKVGVLHSLSGTMAISETALRDTVLMMVEAQNAAGGILGRRLEAVVVDPASNWPLFAEKARELLAVSKVDVTFGCWTSVSRKSVLPVFEELNGLLFYPVQYEGEEESKNIFYTGAAPNQQAIPAVEYLMGPDGGEAKRIALLGTDYVYPRTTNRILRAFLNSKGIPDSDILEEYTPFGHSDWQGIVSRVKRFAGEGKRTAIVSTINGDANVPFYRELGNQGIKAEDIPSVAFSVGEEELAGIDARPLVGHLAAWNYFMSVDSPANTQFKAMWQAYIKNPRRVTNDPMEATFTGFKMWAQAVAKAGTTAVDPVRTAMIGQKVDAPCGYTEEMHANHHLSKPVMIGEIQADGQFNIVWKTPNAIPAENWSPFIPENANRRRG
ncbi:urea ABC transporter substrate-binding protein [Falsiroseomonas oleicola]|uniref:Urea ABC transporter substrate-binding protein n=1 Tax=Falsiroseomonas oleicola TaxID=2801474 RepID=A0ABS6HBA7_9PROT|nr:urea ABC transporter substrate-binding protein [Roseomonas oleicola]MBU8545985.1 urea ABC transporter substrate-binding protein [Roseomonas oleicola]